MNVINIADKRMTLGVTEEEAAHILEGLIRHADDLGAEAEDLRAKLEAAGIAPPPAPDHIRHEY